MNVAALLVLAFLYITGAALVVPAAAIITAAACALTIPACYLVTLVRVLALRPSSLPPPRWFPRGENAELSYFYGPALADVWHIITIAYAKARGLGVMSAQAAAGAVQGGDVAADGPWPGVALAGAVPPPAIMPGRGALGRLRPETRRLIAIPLAIGWALGMAPGCLAGAALLAAIAAVHAAVTAVLFAGARAVAEALRLADSGMLLIKNIRMKCPACYRRVPYPAYLCPGDGCDRVHLDSRPGRHGILRLRCQCGATLPTLLVASSERPPACCPHPDCLHPLEYRLGEAPEVVLPLFGAPGAGKTQLLYAVVSTMRTADGLETEFADTATTEALADAELYLAPDRAVPRTATALPRGRVLRVRHGGQVRLLQLFDPGGELFYRPETIRELGYMGYALTFILVIDPLAIEKLWSALPPERQHDLAASRSDAPPPDEVYRRTRGELEKMGVRLRKARLAVVFSRADLLAIPDGVAADDWARAVLGLGDLIGSARRQFGEVGVFRTASVRDEYGQLDPSVAELTWWLLAPRPARRSG
jgi:hypothetical protein